MENGWESKRNKMKSQSTTKRVLLPNKNSMKKRRKKKAAKNPSVAESRRSDVIDYYNYEPAFTLCH
jgi:hypothetical protein